MKPVPCDHLTAWATGDLGKGRVQGRGSFLLFEDTPGLLLFTHPVISGSLQSYAGDSERLRVLSPSLFNRTKIMGFFPFFQTELG